METPSVDNDLGQTAENVNVDAQLASVEGSIRALDADNPNSEMDSLHERLVAIRLGLASSLFQALRFRDRNTADHCLRVAILCACWSKARGDDEGMRDKIEVAALLHDIGKIGAPDVILKQPGGLSDEQVSLMRNARINGIKILKPCCDSPEVLETIALVGAWFNGSRDDFWKKGTEIPIAARMISIADAYDSMTNDGVYRRAISQERAINELYAYADTQFDPQLVNEFANLHEQGKLELSGDTTESWLNELNDDSRRRWQLSKPVEPETRIEIQEVVVPQVDVASVVAELFHDQLLDSVNDGVLYTDMNLMVTAWNRSAEELTGLQSDAIIDQLWSPKLVKMRDIEGRFINEKTCPVRAAIETGRRIQIPVLLRGEDSLARHIELTIDPAVSENGEILGTIVVFRDGTSTANLEDKVQDLHQKATSDPLTGIANRAEFDRVHEESILRHQDTKETCSLIICDIDHFKSINDQYGHQAGDEALVSFASILQRACREGDLVARYGGEEFVMVCEKCTAADATKIAESIRKTLSETGLRELNGRCITASFGVTELQEGDSAENMLRRADRGLLQAKETGRNRVVQLGVGPNQDSDAKPIKKSWFSWVRSDDPKLLLQLNLATKVPIGVAIQKLQGFVSDHNGEIIKADDSSVEIRITSADISDCRRRSDRPIPFRMKMDFKETVAPDNNKQTEMNVRLLVVNSRERRSGSGEEIARRIVKSLQSYLMAVQVTESDAPQ